MHLERFPLGTEYPAIIGRVEELVSSPKVQPRPRFVIDATGAGRPVVDLFLNRRMPVEIVPLTITAGSEVREDQWNRTNTRAFWVPKIELVSTIQALLQTRRLRVVPRLELADVIKRELLDFKIRITASANETFGVWREGAHDDLVLVGSDGSLASRAPGLSAHDCGIAAIPHPGLSGPTNSTGPRCDPAHGDTVRILEVNDLLFADLLSIVLAYM